MHAAYFTRVRYSATYARKLRHQKIGKRNSAGSPLWLKISLNFVFLNSHENESSDVSDENTQRIEKRKRFPDFSDQHRNQTLVDVKARGTKSSTNAVVKVLKYEGIQIDTS